MDVAGRAYRRLEVERTRLRQLATSLTREFDDIVESAQLANNDDEHDPDGATVAYERAKVAALLASVHRDLLAVDAALERVQAGAYSTCVRCGGEISPDRLEALPSATSCIGCASYR